MTAITLRDGTQVSEEVYDRFGFNRNTPHSEDYVKFFDTIEQMPSKPASRPPAGQQGIFYIDVSRGADGVRQVTLKQLHAAQVKISIPALEKTGDWPLGGRIFSVKEPKNL